MCCCPLRSSSGRSRASASATRCRLPNARACGWAVPLGYDVNDKNLVINPGEAERVRTIFGQYLRLNSITKLSNDLAQDPVKKTARSNGLSRGGIHFSKALSRTC